HVRLQHLYKGDQLVVRPRARVSFELYPCRIEPPHVEDRSFDLRSMALEGISDNLEWETALRRGLFGNVESIFDGHLQARRWVPPGAPTRSLGTVTGVNIRTLTPKEKESSIEYRLSFTDAPGVLYKDIPINDLTFRKFADLENQQGGPTRATAKIMRLLGTMRVYLRLGITRPWSSSGDNPVCWMQVTGIHTFPDYLGGRSFADLEVLQ
ncbi:MAG: hypothetical protein Q8R28_07320, partial [Dehalococcoidia bacterium]|nr:hypothetical protein [Dehalococcoidia bacterium]